MPQATDFSVKDKVGNDIIFRVKSPSAGDKSPAVFRVEIANLPTGLRPQLEVLATSNGNKTARRVVITGNWPIASLDSSTGQQVLLARVPIRYEVTLPTNVSAESVSGGAFVFANVIASALMQATYEDGYAPA